MTQHVLVELADVSQPGLSELEHGTPTARIEAVNRVLPVFGKQLGVVDASRPEVDP